MDRIDIKIDLFPVDLKSMIANEKEETSFEIKKRVTEGRKFAVERFKKCGLNFKLNSEITSPYINEFCKLDDDCKIKFTRIIEKDGISTRGINKILKVARTIADLKFKENINYADLMESVFYATDFKFNNYDKKNF